MAWDCYQQTLTLTFHESLYSERAMTALKWSKVCSERVRWLACCNCNHTQKKATVNPPKLVKFEWEKSKKEVNIEEQKKRAEY